MNNDLTLADFYVGQTFYLCDEERKKEYLQEKQAIEGILSCPISDDMVRKYYYETFSDEMASNLTQTYPLDELKDDYIDELNIRLRQLNEQLERETSSKDEIVILDISEEDGKILLEKSFDEVWLEIDFFIEQVKAGVYINRPEVGRIIYRERKQEYFLITYSGEEFVSEYLAAVKKFKLENVRYEICTNDLHTEYCIRKADAKVRNRQTISESEFMQMRKNGNVVLLAEFLK